MKVHIISGSYPPMQDGVGDYTKQLFFSIKRYYKEALEVFLITTRTESSEDHIEDGVFPIADNWGSRDICGIIRFICKRCPDIVHIQYPANGYKRSVSISFLPIMLQVFSPKTRLICTIHEFNNRTFLGKMRLYIGILFCDQIIVVSVQYVKELLRWPFLFYKKITVIPVGANLPKVVDPDLSLRKQFENRFNIKQDDRIVAHFGVIRPSKGIEFLLKEFRNAVSVNNRLKLVLIGWIDQKYYGSVILPMIKEEFLEKHVILTGDLSSREASECISMAEICVLPYEDGVSTKRGSFMAVLQNNIPVITTRPGVEFGEIKHERNAFLVNYGEDATLGNSIIGLIDNEPLKRKITSGMKDLADKYSWRSIVESTVRVYLSIG